MTTITLQIYILFILLIYFAFLLLSPDMHNATTTIYYSFRDWRTKDTYYVRVSQKLKDASAIITPDATHYAATTKISKKKHKKRLGHKKRGKKKGSLGGGFSIKIPKNLEQLRVVKLFPKDAPPGAKISFDHSHYVVDLDISIEEHIELVIVRYDVYRYWDPITKKIVRAQSSEPGVRYGAAYKGFVLTSYFCDNMPLSSIHNFLKRFLKSYACSKQAILEWIKEAGTTLKPYYNTLKELTKLAKSLGIDETGVRINAIRFWVWVLTTPAVVLYHLDEHRSREVAQQLLDGYNGLVTSDFFKAYDKLGVRHQRCLTHLIRKVVDAVNRAIKEVVKMQKKLKEYEASQNSKGEKKRKRGRPKKTVKLSKQDVEKLHREIEEKQHVIVTGINLIHFITSITSGKYEYDDALKAVKEVAEDIRKYKEFYHVGVLMKKYLGEIVEFLREPVDEKRKAWTNNDTERSVKAFAKYRRTRAFRSEEIVRAIVIVISVVESYRRVVGEFNYEVWVRLISGDFRDLEYFEEKVREMLQE